jgi:ankyrin repeat protein
VVKTLLAAEAEVNKANSDGETPLHRASFNGHLEVVKTLLAAEAEVNKADKWR